MIQMQRRTIHTHYQTHLAFYVEYNLRLFDLWLNGRNHSAAFQLCQTRINDLRDRIPQAQRLNAMRRFLTESSFFTDNGSSCSVNLEPLFLPVAVPNVLFQEEAHVSN